MNAIAVRLSLAAAAAGLIIVPSLNASAQSQVFTPVKLVKQGSSTLEPAGAGKVTVQVEVHPDGTVRVIRVIRSSNPADDAAAMDLARNSQYRPATRGGRKITAFYDFVVSFGSHNVSAAASQIDQLLHTDQWAAAKDAAVAALAKDPNDKLVQAQLGVALALTHDVTGAAAAFDKAGTIPPQYANIAMQTYTLDSADIAQSNPPLAVARAQKAVALKGDYNAYYSLGLAQSAAGDNGAALTALQKARAMADAANADVKSKVNIDAAALRVYSNEKDSAGVAKMQAEIKVLDPTGQYGSKVAAYLLDERAAALSRQGNWGAAGDLYVKAAEADPSWAGLPEYTKAAIMYLSGAQPDYLKAKATADKALALNPHYPIAEYAAGTALVEDAKVTGNMSQTQDGNVYLRGAIADAKAQGNDALAKDIQFYIDNGYRDNNIHQWMNTLRVNSTIAPGT